MAQQRMGLVPDGLQRHDSSLGTALARNHPVKIEIDSKIARGRAVGAAREPLHLVLEALKLRDCRGRDPARGPLGRETLECQADVVEVADVARRESDDLAPAVAGCEFQHPVLLELAKRQTDSRARYIEPFAKRLLGHVGADRQRAGENLLVEGLHGPFAERPTLRFGRSLVGHFCIQNSEWKLLNAYARRGRMSSTAADRRRGAATSMESVAEWSRKPRLGPRSSQSILSSFTCRSPPRRSRIRPTGSPGGGSSARGLRRDPD